ncbi:bacteriophage replication gene A family protein, partial [Vibrio parahaemolyticus VPTS-2010_2]
RLVTAIWLKRV